MRVCDWCVAGAFNDRSLRELAADALARTMQHGQVILARGNLRPGLHLNGAHPRPSPGAFVVSHMVITVPLMNATDSHAHSNTAIAPIACVMEALRMA